MLISWISVRRSSAMLSSAAEQMLKALGAELQASMAAVFDPERTGPALGRLQVMAGRRSLAERLEAHGEVQQSLAETPNVRAYFVGYGDGQMFMVARASDAVGRRLAGLPAGAALVVESIAPDVVAGQGVVRPYAPNPAFRRQQLLLDSQRRPIRPSGEAMLLPEAFDPRPRPWYRLAQESLDPVLSPVYRLALGNQLGVTLSQMLPRREGVAAMSL
ncbi:MAG: hypothetical protein ACKO6F_11795 [Cyanobium sp.]